MAKENSVFVLLLAATLLSPVSCGFWGSVRDALLNIGTAVVPDASKDSVATVDPDLRLFGSSYSDHSVVARKYSSVDGSIVSKLRNANSVTVVVHGLKGGINDGDTLKWSKPLIENLLQVQKQNERNYVLFLDWSPGAKSSGLRVYSQAAANTETVGMWLADMLINSFKIDGKRTKTHCIGFSLGSHVCGVAGAQLSRLGTKRFHRISGLDPPYQRFNDKNSFYRLDNTDADYVDVIVSTQMGLTDGTVGDLVILLNDANSQLAKIQPGCSVLDLDGGKCSHRRAAQFYASTVTSKTRGNPSCHYFSKLQGHVGYWAGNSQKGRYTVYASAESPPYCVDR